MPALVVPVFTLFLYSNASAFPRGFRHRENDAPSSDGLGRR